jgi:hypothetical protein
LEINKLLFRAEKEERKNTNNKRGHYEIKISLFNDLDETKIIKFLEFIIYSTAENNIFY